MFNWIIGAGLLDARICGICYLLFVWQAPPFRFMALKRSGLLLEACALKVVLFIIGLLFIPFIGVLRLFYRANWVWCCSRPAEPTAELVLCLLTISKPRRWLLALDGHCEINLHEWTAYEAMSIKGSERKCRGDEPWWSEGEKFFFVLVYDCRIKVNAYIFPAKIGYAWHEELFPISW